MVKLYIFTCIYTKLQQSYIYLHIFILNFTQNYAIYENLYKITQNYT